MASPPARPISRCPPVLMAGTLAVVVAASAAGQRISDSAARLNASGRWQGALRLASARPTTASGQDQAESCRLLVQLLVAYDRLGRLENGAARLEQYDRSCQDVKLDTGEARLLRTTRRDFVLPAMPTSGLDFSGIDRFWRVVDTLTADREPSEALWHSMFVTPGYRLSFFNVQPLRSDYELAFRPSRAHERDSILARKGDDADRLSHLGRAIAQRGELERFRDSLERTPVTRQALALTARFLPPGITRASTPPFVAFAVFREDAYATGPRTVCVDLIRALDGGLDVLLAHEFHHTFLYAITRVPIVSDDSADGLLMNSLTAVRAEGLADLIDKPSLLAAPPPELASYAKRYVRERDSAAVTLRAIDAILAHASHDSVSLRNTGKRVAALLWSGGHPVGGYMARRIVDTFGVDSIFPGAYSPFAFFRTYVAAERVHGAAPPFSDQTNALLAWEEERYTRR
jgi:hypothetical protein